MGTRSVGSSSHESNGLQAILWGGLLAGTLDITAACINANLRAGMSPKSVFQFVASGWFGAASFKGGYKTAAIGLASHYLIAFGATIVFYLASRMLRVLVNHAIVCGLLYGVAVFAVTNFVVVPLSAIGHVFAFTRSGFITNLLIIIFCIGLPIGLVVRRYSK